MTSAPVSRTDAPPAAFRAGPGAVLALVLFCIYGGLALSVDFPKAALGFQSDEATYYMMGYSLAMDGDLTYRRADLMRVWREFPTGPSGVFLKRGRDVTDWGFMRRPPFVWTTTVPDSDTSRYFFGKSFIYSAFAAPFVRVFGTNGFLVFHAILLSLVAWCGYLFLHARMPATPAALLTGAFLMASVVPVYFVWIAPELFNFAVGFLAYFCWLYKEVGVGAGSERGQSRVGAGSEQGLRGVGAGSDPGLTPRWLGGASSDYAAAALLGIVTFSKITNALLFPPIVMWHLWQRQWRRAIVSCAAFVVVAGGLFAINTAISGEWNYQGGEDRRTFYAEFPLQTPASGIEVGSTRERNETLTDIIFDPRVFWTNLAHNLGYFFVGRYAGIGAYFFPAVFAIVAFAIGLRRRPAWQYLVAAAAVAQMLIFIVATPYTWNGGGGSVGNRYFMSAYGLFLFLLPSISRTAVTAVPWVIGALFTAPLVLNPFAASFYPGNNAKSGPLRWLPVELTLVYDWPINNDRSRVMLWFGDHEGVGDLGFQIYYFDDNAYQPETDKTFWVKGESRAEFLIKTDQPFSQAVFTLKAGPVPTDVVVQIGRRSQAVSLRAGEEQRVLFRLDPGFLYQGTWPVWKASVSSSSGFVPIFHEAGTSDVRYLGVRVDPMLVK